MKKLLLPILALSAVIGIAGCASKEKTTTASNTTSPKTTEKITTTEKMTTTEAKKETVKILCPNGTPFMSVAGLKGENGIDIENVAGADPLKAEIGGNTKTKDIVIAPLNVGLMLYNKSETKDSAYKLAAVVTVDNTYLVSKAGVTLNSLDDLKDKKIVAYGKGATPQYAFENAISTTTLTENDYEIDYLDNVNLAMAEFTKASSEYDYCLMAEPQITTLKVKKGLDINVKSLSDYYEDIIYQAGIFVNPNSNQTRVNEVLDQIKTNINYLNNNANDYANKIVNVDETFTTMGVEVIAKAIPNANINYIAASENKVSITTYYTKFAKIANVPDAFFK